MFGAEEAPEPNPGPHHTGKTVEQIEKDADRDNYMTAAQAAEYGLVDKVLEKKLPDLGGSEAK